MKNIVFLLGILPFLASAQLTSLVSHGNYYWVKNPSTGDSVRMLCPADTTNLGNKLAPNGNGSALTGLTKTQVGLNNVDNTSDVNKPISSLTQAALDAKQATGNYVTSGGALGTPSSGTLTNCTFPTLNQNTSGTAGGLSANIAESQVTSLVSDLALKAPLASPTFTGTVTLPASTSLTTPVLGTPTSVTLTNATGLPVSTGISGLAAGVATFLATPTSANLAAAITNETGTGLAVFATTPTLTTPVIGAATGTSLSLTGNSTWNGFAVNIPTTSAPTTGGTVAAATTQWNVINPAGTLSTLTVTLPTSPVNGQEVVYSFTQIITTLTFTGGTLQQSITTAAVNQVIRLGFVTSLSKWVTK